MKTATVLVCSGCFHPVNQHRLHKGRKSHKLGCQHLIRCSTPYEGNHVYCSCLLGPKECGTVEWDRKKYDAFAKQEMLVVETEDA